MAKRTNYGFVKREKELKRQAKKAEKLEKKKASKEAPPPADEKPSEE